MRVAIVHYWFLNSGGGERVVEVLGDMFPQADLFTLFAEPGSVPSNLAARNVTVSFLDKSKLARRYNRAVFPLYPLAIESFDLRGYDLIISSDSPPMKGVLTTPDQLHVCYCHTPGRYLWDLHETFKKSLPWPAQPAFSIAAGYLRRWDYRAAQRVNKFVANSNYVANRIKTYYDRESTVIYPPVNTGGTYIDNDQWDSYLHVGRLVENKRIDLVIQACNRLGRNLLIAGTGRAEKMLRDLAGPTVKFLGRVEDALLPELYAKSRALVFAAEEDFGIVPLEAQSYGRPVIAYGEGGSLETVVPYGSSSRPTGIHFGEQTVDSVCEGILKFESVEHVFNPATIRAFAQSFDTSVFVQRMSEFISSSLEEKNGAETMPAMAHELSRTTSASV
jgi:glycosyltransferase involved in cell wall biosynthesis